MTGPFPAPLRPALPSGTLPSPQGQPWPRSPGFWATAIYLGLFVIRPWEKLFPWMQVIPAERACALLTLVVIFLEGRLTLRLDGQSLAILAFLTCIGFT